MPRGTTDDYNCGRQPICSNEEAHARVREATIVKGKKRGREEGKKKQNSSAASKTQSKNCTAARLQVSFISANPPSLPYGDPTTAPASPLPGVGRTKLSKTGPFTGKGKLREVLHSRYKCPGTK